MNLNIDEVLKLFPMPNFRKLQKELLVTGIANMNTGVKCIILDAATGFGKSGDNITFCRAANSAFYITPQLGLIDQLKKDKYLSPHLVEIKGRQNYPCSKDPNASCDVGLCSRIKDAHCEKKLECPYWIQKMKALQAHTALMSFSYFVLEGANETEFSFGRRELLVCDEAHSIDKHVVNHVSFTISPYSIPLDIYTKIQPQLDCKTYDDAITIAGTARDMAQIQIDATDMVVQQTLTGGVLTMNQAVNLKRLKDFVQAADRFLNTKDEIEWVWQKGWSTYHQEKCQKLWFQPLYARPFMVDMVWSRAKYYIISSATILNVDLFLRETGLDKILKKDEILHINIPSQFPVENRQIIDKSVGKMTQRELETNLPAAVKVLEKIIDLENGKNIAVHCHSYKMAHEILNRINERYTSQIIAHTGEDRQDKLEEWINSRGKVFLAVSFEEGQDWIGDICEAQVLFKVPYMDISDERVRRRLDRKDWAWYNNEALKTIIQSYGRAVRSPEDKARYYVIDSCFIEIMQRCKRDVPRWFSDALPEHMRLLIGVKK